jgi:WD40 repeat protein
MLQSSGRMEADFSSDGSLIASGGGDDAEIYLWDGFTGVRKERLLPQLHSDMLIDIAFALSDRVIISISNDNRIICWSVAPTERWIPRGKVMQGEKHSARMTKLAVSPDGKSVATFSVDRSIRLWSAERIESAGVPMIGNSGALSGAFSVDGAKIVAGYENGEVIVWDVATQTPIHRLPSDEKRVHNVTLSPDGKIIASGNARLCLWDIDTGTLLCPPLAGYTSSVGRLAFNRQGNRLVSGSIDHIVRVWDIRRNGAEVNVSGYALNGHTRYINDIFVSPDGRWVTSASDDGTIRVWDTDLRDASDINEPLDFTHDEVRHLAFSRDGRRLASAGTEGTLQLWDATTGRKIGNQLQSGRGHINKLLFSWHNKLWASGHVSGDVCLWQSEDDNVHPTMHILPCQQGSLKYIVFLPNDSYLATGGNDHVVQIWDIATRSCKARLDCSSSLRQIAVSKDGLQLASYSVDGNVRLWDLTSYNLIAGPTAVHSQDFLNDMEMDHMVFSPDGKTIATSYGYLLRLLDVENNLRSFTSLLKRTRTLDDLTNPVPAFSADGKYVFYEHHVLTLASLNRQDHIKNWPPEDREGRAFNPTSPLFISPRWTNICSIRWSKPLLVAPADMKIVQWVAHDNMLAFGTTDGRVFILRFPKEYI